MNDYDRAYYAVRGAKSRELAGGEGDPEIAATYLKTADRYDKLASSKVRQQPTEIEHRCGTGRSSNE